jgi:hypothetical protein
MSQIGALRQPGPHMLGPLGANANVVQAGVRPPTQSVTHPDTDRENEAMQGYTDTQFREARPKADTYTRTASAHVVRSYRERDTHTQTHLSISLIQAHAHPYTHRYIHAALVLFLSYCHRLSPSYLLAHTYAHTHLVISLTHTHTHTHMHTQASLSLSLSVGLPHTHTLTRTHWTPTYHPHAHRYVGGAEGGRPKDNGTRTRHMSDWGTAPARPPHAWPPRRQCCCCSGWRAAPHPVSHTHRHRQRE